MGETLRFGIIGAGVIGQVHARAITGLPEARLVAVTDSVPEKAEQLAETYDLTAYTDIQQMLKQEKAAIASPIGKVPVDIPFTEHLQRFIRAIAVAQRFQTRYIRLFSFYPPAFPEADSHDPSCHRQEHPLRASFFFLLGNQTGMTDVSARAPPDEEGERAFLALAIFRSRKKTDIFLRRQRANARSRWQHFGR